MENNTDGDIYEPYHDCEGDCTDYRKNLRCCREVEDNRTRIQSLEMAVEELKKYIKTLPQVIEDCICSKTLVIEENIKKESL